MEALVPPQDLPPREGLVAHAADVPLPGVGDHLLEPPGAVSTGAEAADAMAGVKALVVTQVLQRMQTAAAFRILSPRVAILKRPLGLGHRQHVHQVDPAGARQLRLWRGQFQFHVQVIVLLWCVDPLPNPDLGGCQGAIRGGRTVGGAPGGADAGLLMLGFDGHL